MVNGNNEILETLCLKIFKSEKFFYFIYRMIRFHKKSYFYLSEYFNGVIIFILFRKAFRKLSVGNIFFNNLK